MSLKTNVVIAGMVHCLYNTNRAFAWKTTTAVSFAQCCPHRKRNRSVFKSKNCRFWKLLFDMLDFACRVNATPENQFTNFSVTYRVGQKMWYLSYITLHCTRGITFLAHPVFWERYEIPMAPCYLNTSIIPLDTFYILNFSILSYIPA